MTRKISFLLLVVTLLSWPLYVGADNDRIKEQLAEFMLNCNAKTVAPANTSRVIAFSVNDRRREFTVNVSDAFASQEFTPSLVKSFYRKLGKALSKPYSRYRLRIVTCGLPIEELVDGALSDNPSLTRSWGDIEYTGNPWVKNVSRPFSISHGLFNRHLTLWASHGIYYDGKKSRWKWQRPNLFGTTEDLFTQTIVVPYLMPMLENAGAVVFSPRERSWQKNEVIVDNDMNPSDGAYTEENGRNDWGKAPQKGFAFHKGAYHDGENAFVAGTARMAKTVSKKGESWISYQPYVPETGDYAVYVSYQSLPNSVSDAEYIVFHQGERTVFRVNQQMGGSTWVYLGQFRFDKGSSAANRVVLTNMSHEKGVVTADAVRFGGGMGNISREGKLSGMPRCLEGARYSAQWAGAPYSVYGGRNGLDDYADDINTRSGMSNWLAGGSVYVPSLEGRHVPIELSLAVHSDAGYTQNFDSIVGSLAICTTNFNDGRLNSGISRYISSDFADSLLAGIQRDITAKYKKWNRREIYDRNYSETRRPEVPSAIIETMSHQNFYDMLRGHDPNFRFTLARSLYKTILKFVNGNHGRPSVVQPLPPNSFRVEKTGEGRFRLSWAPVSDPLEPTAVPTSYNVYVATGNGGFDNGTVVNTSSFTFDPQPGELYRFRVTALNRGGESFPTETLAACLVSATAPDVLVVNGFTRLSSPSVVNNATSQGFDLDDDIGVSYGLTAGWNGAQQCFDKSRTGIEGPGGLGYSGDELAGRFIMGNSFDAAVSHVKAIAATGKYNVVSSSLGAVESGMLPVKPFACVDIAFGLQKDDGHSLVYYKTFTPSLRKVVADYARNGGRIIVSGAYTGSDMRTDDEQNFLASVMKTRFGGSNQVSADNTVTGLGTTFDIIRHHNDKHFAARSVDVLVPAGGSFCAMKYADDTDAAVAYDGTDYKCFVMGFPFECINNLNTQRLLMKGILGFVMK